MESSRPERAVRLRIGVSGRCGQSLVETCIVVGVICLIFMAAFQVSQVFAARDILHHSAARGARARTVGFNHWMVVKCMRVAAIPNAGRMVVPNFESDDSQLESWLALSPGEFWDRVLVARPQSQQFPMEEARIPEYLSTFNAPRSNHILDYENWDTVHTPSPESGPVLVEAHVSQDYLLWVPLRETFYGSKSARLTGESAIENYYPIYLEDMDW